MTADQEGPLRGSYRRRKPVCPACGAPLRTSSRLWGILRSLPSACDACGTALSYDTAGGIYAARDG